MFYYAASDQPTDHACIIILWLLYMYMVSIVVETSATCIAWPPTLLAPCGLAPALPCRPCMGSVYNNDIIVLHVRHIIYWPVVEYPEAYYTIATTVISNYMIYHSSSIWQLHEMPQKPPIKFLLFFFCYVRLPHVLTVATRRWLFWQFGILFHLGQPNSITYVHTYQVHIAMVGFVCVGKYVRIWRA